MKGVAGCRHTRAVTHAAVVLGKEAGRKDFNKDKQQHTQNKSLVSKVGVGIGGAIANIMASRDACRAVLEKGEQAASAWQTQYVAC